MDFGEKSLELHRKIKGKLKVESKVKLKNKEDLSISYTPGIAKVSEEVFKDKNKAKELTIKSNWVAVISNGTAVLGLGNIGALASLPVMEGKCVLMKELADVNAIPLVIDEKNPEQLVEIIKKVSIQFAAINLEDIKAPDCFFVERKLKEELDIPVFHDDQHGTAIVVLTGLINALLLREGKINKNVKIVINGAGAAGNAIFWLLWDYGFRNIIVLDSKGSLSLDREDLDKYKKEIADKIKLNKKINLKEALEGADVFIGVSKGNLLEEEDIERMKDKAIIFAMANPIPELIVEKAIRLMIKESKKAYLEKLKEINPEKYEQLKDLKTKKEKILIYATGRSDLPNQLNNALIFPGLFKGVVEGKINKLERELFKYIANSLVEYWKDKREVAFLMPSVLDKELHNYIAKKVKEYKKLV